MRYQVPQFIEIEDKIFGPLTLKQFIYLAGGGGLCLIFFSLLPLYLTVILAIPVIALSAGLAFYQVNGRPLIVVIEHAFSYILGHKLYLWKQHEAKTPEAAVAPTAVATVSGVPKLSESKLKDLAWSLNIKDRAKMGVADTTARTGFEI
ncbi:MAG TPA: PrgI family protein [Candidatus Paceibacterota bacterium]|nr:PrgI family protein [Candidatus Paceibacterota bacterium]